MAMTSADYLQQLQALLPIGRAWPRQPEAILTRRLQALADELARVDARAHDALNEIIPDTAVERLPEWEILTGVSGREAVLAQMAAQGGSTETYFIELASVLGLDITIDDDLNGFVPFFDCQSPCDASLGGYDDSHHDDFSCQSHCDDFLQGWNKRFWWQVNVGSAAPQPALEALFIKLKPAHTRVTFVYAGSGFGGGGGGGSGANVSRNILMNFTPQSSAQPADGWIEEHGHTVTGSAWQAYGSAIEVGTDEPCSIQITPLPDEFQMLQSCTMEVAITAGGGLERVDLLSTISGQSGWKLWIQNYTELHFGWWNAGYFEEYSTGLYELGGQIDYVAVTYNANAGQLFIHENGAPSASWNTSITLSPMPTGPIRLGENHVGESTIHIHALRLTDHRALYTYNDPYDTPPDPMDWSDPQIMLPI